MASESVGLSDCNSAHRTIDARMAGSARNPIRGLIPVLGRPRTFCLTVPAFFILLYNKKTSRAEAVTSPQLPNHPGASGAAADPARLLNSLCLTSRAKEQEGHVIDQHPLTCADEDEARKSAKVLADSSLIEIWDAPVRIARFIPSTKAVTVGGRRVMSRMSQTACSSEIVPIISSHFPNIYFDNQT